MILEKKRNLIHVLKSDGWGLNLKTEVLDGRFICILLCESGSATMLYKHFPTKNVI